MTALVRAELLKLRTTWAPYGWTLAALALAALGTAGAIGGAESSDRFEADFFPELVSTAGVSNLVAALVGIAIVTSEWRYGTVASTFLVVPARTRVLAAKAAAAGVSGVVLGAGALAVVLGVAIPWLAALGVPAHVGERGGQLAGVLVAAALGGMLGVAIGALVHSQVPAFVGTLVWFLIAEPVTVGLLPEEDYGRVLDLLPARALGVLDGSSDHITWWRGVMVVLYWVVVLGLPGVLRTRRRDVT